MVDVCRLSAGCNASCPLDEFIKLTHANIPSDWHAECRATTLNVYSQSTCISLTLSISVSLSRFIFVSLLLTIFTMWPSVWKQLSTVKLYVKVSKNLHETSPSAFYFKTKNAWQSLAYSLLGAVVSPYSEYSWKHLLTDYMSA